MADEQVQPTPVAPSPAPVAPPSFQDKLKMDAKSLWEDHKLFFILFGLLVLVVKFRDIAIDLLVSGAKKETTAAKKEDSSLATDENNAKASADALVQKAAEEPAKETPVGDDWYKK